MTLLKEHAGLSSLNEFFALCERCGKRPAIGLKVERCWKAETC
jgi:hypothetical protein